MSISSQWWMLAETIVRHERDDPGALMSDVHENAKKTGNHAPVRAAREREQTTKSCRHGFVVGSRSHLS